MKKTGTLATGTSRTFLIDPATSRKIAVELIPPCNALLASFTQIPTGRLKLVLAGTVNPSLRKTSPRLSPWEWLREAASNVLYGFLGRP